MSARNPVLDVGSEFEALVRELEDRVDNVVEALERRVMIEFPAEWSVDRPELVDARRHFTRRSVLAEYASMRRGVGLPDACPPEDSEHARVAAQMGSPVNLLVWGYRAGHAEHWETWFSLVEALDLEPEPRRALLERGSRFFFAYADRLTDLVTKEYTKEREWTLRSYEQRRVHLVHELIAGHEVDTGALDYDTNGFHVGVIGWGEAPAEAVAELARGCDRRPLVVNLGDLTTLWAWLGGARELTPEARLHLRQFVPRPGTHLAIGREAAGGEGFRRTHREAGYADHVSRRTDAPVVHFDDIALEALASRDESEARAFVAAELSGIDGRDRRSERLRETLLAYFAAGQNAAATATVLGVHEQTVAQRIRAVEERIGRPVPARRAELEAALRLQRYLETPATA